jgi:hypothetical protein
MKSKGYRNLSNKNQETPEYGIFLNKEIRFPHQPVKGSDDDFP